MAAERETVDRLIAAHLAKQTGAVLLPIDSEHSAVFQSMTAGRQGEVSKVFLTASGGPFRTWTAEQMANATVEDALRHPTWKMGPKITIDSATMMNKALEIIEARWLFNVPAEKIDVIIHPQSIIHSMVQFVDGSVKAQMSRPDMRLPIMYALTWPERMAAPFQTGGINDIFSLTFEKADAETFRHLSLAYEAIAKGGGAPCVLNASNEVAVELFLNNKISFTGMQKMSETALSHISAGVPVNITDYLALDSETRAYCQTMNIK